MKRLPKFLMILMIGVSGSATAQVIARFEVESPSTGTEIGVPVSVNIGNLTKLREDQLTLQEVTTQAKVPVPFQLDKNAGRTMHWLVAFSERGQKKVFELINKRNNNSPRVLLRKDDKNFTIRAESKNLLRYVHAVTYPPAGIDPSYARSGYIHPLWSPHGQELTRIQPPDHYHHYGLWNPWTHVLYNGDTIDFWNIGGKKGTVRFAKTVSSAEGPVYAELKVLHEHVVTKTGTPPQVALNEIQTIRVYNPQADYFVVDFTFDLQCATQNPVTLLEYRYGGLGWRTTEKWDNKNSEVITSEGKSRKEADGSMARWCIVQGALDSDYGGAAMMSHPSNYNHPEPLRIWPENQYNRGDMFANFSPTKNKDWILQPGQTYSLKYRFLVYNGRMTKEKAEEAWSNFSSTPTVVVK
jgi:hypothetical protein